MEVAPEGEGRISVSFFTIMGSATKLAGAEVVATVLVVTTDVEGADPSYNHYFVNESDEGDG